MSLICFIRGKNTILRRRRAASWELRRELMMLTTTAFCARCFVLIRRFRDNSRTFPSLTFILNPAEQRSDSERQWCRRQSAGFDLYGNTSDRNFRRGLSNGNDLRRRRTSADRCANDELPRFPARPSRRCRGCRNDRNSRRRRGTVSGNCAKYAGDVTCRDWT